LKTCTVKEVTLRSARSEVPRRKIREDDRLGSQFGWKQRADDSQLV
jgi:hypothetical protein